ncbi:MAG: class IV adenylate cyclase [Planctomycetota bacterium]|nr:class IV adenylate cyclase [Planctomycetota bacterium]
MNNAAGPPGLACNVELKARLASAVKAHQVARELATAPVEQQFQLDTYFSCQHGRLKLREIDHQRGQLIWYQRADRAMARESHYRLVEIADPETLRRALGDALGVSGKVEKQRTIYWFENVRIHVDEVVSLGDFLEFEAIITDMDSRKAAEAKLQGLSEAFSLRANDLLTMSYGDMVNSEEGLSARPARE